MKKLPVLAALSTTGLLLPLAAIAQTSQPASPPALPPQGYGYGYGPWGMMGGHMWGGGYGHSLGGALMMLVLFALVVSAVMLLFSRRGHHDGGVHRWNDPGRSALQILNERLARGEIQKEEYAEKKTLILSDGPR